MKRLPRATPEQSLAGDPAPGTPLWLLSEQNSFIPGSQCFSRASEPLTPTSGEPSGPPCPPPRMPPLSRMARSLIPGLSH